MNNKIKKWLLIAGCLVICAVLVVLIGSSFSKEPVQDDPVISTDDADGDVTVNPNLNLSGSDNDDTPAIVINPSTDKAAVTGGGAVSSGTEQTIQPDVTKPEVDEKALTDPSKTPDGQTVVGTPEAVDHDSVESPTTPPSQQGQPSGGDTSGGKIFVPGFGWIENEGGGAQGTDADDMYENGNKIGIMD